MNALQCAVFQLLASLPKESNMAEQKLGVVVIGIGIAGRIRIQDLSKCDDFEETNRAHLIGYVSRRQLEIEGATQIELEDVLKRNDVDILIICTENERHEELARRGLEAGKHVLVEYPLARTAERARELYRLADEKKVILYEEDISLLLDTHVGLKKLIKEKPKLIEGKSTLEGRFNGWIEDLEKSGTPFHTSISQLHRLLSLYPNLSATESTIERKEKMIKANAMLTNEDGGVITLGVLREVLDTPKRSSAFYFKFADGSELDNSSFPAQSRVPEPGKPGLFMKDFMQFLAIVESPSANESHKSLTLKSLELADELYSMAKENSKSQF